jgi:outer membrane protein, multidrug efflux system
MSETSKLPKVGAQRRHPTQRRWVLASVLASTVLAGCAAPRVPQIKATVETVAQKLEPAWQAPTPHGGDLAQLSQWWAKWNDPVLTELQARAQNESASLAQAAAKIDQARAQLAVTGASLKPNVDLSNSLRRSALGVPPFGAPRTQLSSSLDASWELDLFGAIARGQEAAAERLSARQIDWHEARVSLAGEVASNYVGYHQCIESTAALEEDVAALTSTVNLTEQKVRVGLTAPADAALLRASLANSRNQVITQQGECKLLLKALGFLTATKETSLIELMSPLAESKSQAKSKAANAPAFAVSALPAQTLAQRADLAALERELAALAAEVGIAEANRKPKLTFSGNIGWGALRFGGQNGPETGSGVAWGFGPALSLPIFDGGRRKASADAAMARYTELAAQYQFKARMAVREAEEAMVRLDGATQKQAQAEAAIKDFQAYLAAAQTRFRVGVGNLIELQDARRQTIAAQLSLIQLRRDRNLQWIALYKALGGGWDGQSQMAQASEPKSEPSKN